MRKPHDDADAPPALPATLNTDQTSGLFGVARGTLWAAARDGDAPVEPIKVGRAVRWPTAPVLAKLGLDERAAYEILAKLGLLPLDNRATDPAGA